MITAAVARRLGVPIDIRTFQTRRYCVRDWRRSDGGLPGWKCLHGEFYQGDYNPRHAGEFVSIVRLSDGAINVAPRWWWLCDPRGTPTDTDTWADAAWQMIEVHHKTQGRWWWPR